ncbi:solute carrier family 46 member 3 isoform X2 [Hyalella azteca]|nr:solute carrier family 46 member 3 isoform X2 [Hyalella azteca]XP_018026748.1 solute carrier family 46 member 3 isoform X2 [Hyalella azteca]
MAMARILSHLPCYFKWRATVEPVVMLYMLPTFMLLPLLQDLIYNKVCLSMYKPLVCKNLNETANLEAMNEVQAHSAHWIQASTIVMCLPSMIVGQILGTYSDERGRKIPLIFPPLGGVLASLVYVLLSGNVVDLDVSWILLASFLTGLGGAFPGCLNTCASYLSEVSTQVVRTSRIGLMEVMSLIGACLGPLLVGLLQNYYNKDKIFTVILALHAVNVIYILLLVPNVYASRHVSRLCPGERTSSENSSGRGSILAFTWQRVKLMFGVICKTRHENRKTYLLLLLLAAAILMFCTTGTLDVLYLFVKDRPLDWSLEQYSRYFALNYGLALASLLLVMLPLSRCTSDAVILFVGSMSRLAFLLLLGFANTSLLVYITSVVGCASSWCLPALRSSMSKLVEPEELGRVFGLLGIVENACTLLASSVFSSLYPLTRDAYHGAVFFGAATLMVLPTAVAITLYRPLRRLARYSAMEAEENATCPDDDTGGTDDSQHRAPSSELSLGAPLASDTHVATPQDGTGSISSNSSRSSASTPITPITPSSIISGVAVSHFPEIVDTNFSTNPELNSAVIRSSNEGSRDRSSGR